MYVVVIGIDRYCARDKLHNAVSDARGARDAFVPLGFKEFRPPLFDEAATGAALRRLVTDELRALGDDDSLVLFFAGHGQTVTTTYPDGTVAKRGYLVPVDAEPVDAGIGTCVSLESWLHDVAHLPPKHILVVIDACHSGIALNPVIRWRGEDVRTSEPLAKLRVRRSRRIITSALDNELAMDGGPIEGHSLFTGCLVEALTGGLLAKTGQSTATGSEIALHVQRRVSSFPSSHQTPDFGALELDDRGELIIELPEPPATTPNLGVDGILPRRHKAGSARPSSTSNATSPTSTPDTASAKSPIPASGVDSIQPKRTQSDRPAAEATPGKPYPTPDTTTLHRESSAESLSPTPPESTSSSLKQAATAPPPPIQASPASASAPQPAPGLGARSINTVNHPRDRAQRINPVETAFVAALDRHQAARQRGSRVLTLVTADPTTAMTGWASWAAARGYLTLATEATGLGAVTANLLDQMPWLRVLRSARTRLAAVAKLEASAVDDALDARSSSDREAWIDEVAGHDVHARVGGWLLSMIREPWGRVPDLTTAPVQGGDLLSALCELTAPITVLLHHAEPTAAWLERAIQTAAELVGFLPHRAIAVSAPSELATAVVRGRSESAALALARQGEVPLAARIPRALDPARSHAEHVLHAALARDPRTAGLFEPNVPVPTHDRDRAVEVDLIARDALLAIEIDSWYQFHDPKAYARDRIKDVWLSRAQFFVMRFLIEDIEERIEQTVHEIAIGLAGRRASGAFVENSQ